MQTVTQEPCRGLSEGGDVSRDMIKDSSLLRSIKVHAAKAEIVSENPWGIYLVAGRDRDIHNIRPKDNLKISLNNFNN